MTFLIGFIALAADGVGTSSARLSSQSRVRSAATADHIESVFVFEGSSKLDSPVAKPVLNYNFRLVELSPDRIDVVRNSYRSSLTASSFQEQIVILKRDRQSLTLDERLVLIGAYGAKLGDNYDPTLTENHSFESMFDSLKVNSQQSGICTDIHLYLGEVAKALGFDQVGIHTGTYARGIFTKNPGGHAMAHFRDPESGEYYIANYSKLFATHQKSLQAAVDFSLKYMGAFSDLSYVQSRPDRIHTFTPQTAQWVKGLLQQQATYDPKQGNIAVRIGNQEQRIGFSAGNQTEVIKVKAFAMQSRYAASEGPYTLVAAGVSADMKSPKKLRTGIIHETGTEARVAGGVFQINAPVIDNSGSQYEQLDQANIFVDTYVSGFARINKVTGLLEIENTNLNVLSVKNPSSGTGTFIRDLSLRTAVEHNWDRASIPMKLRAERSFENVPDHLGRYNRQNIQVAYDSVGIIFENHSKDMNKVYLVVGSHLYALEGVDSMAASAIKNSVQVSFPSTGIGIFSVRYDLVNYLTNPSRDPFYDSANGQNLTAGWQKKLRGPSSVGVDLNYSRGNQIFPFGTLGELFSPESVGAEQMKGMLFFKTSF